MGEVGESSRIIRYKKGCAAELLTPDAFNVSRNGIYHATKDRHTVGKGINVRRIGYRYQRTIADTVDVSGYGHVTGQFCRMKFHPAPSNTGIVFRRSDIEGDSFIPAHVYHVHDTERRTTLRTDIASVLLVEHTLAALAGLRIDNCSIELDSSEPPGLDGSSGAFVRLLNQVGTITQETTRGIWAVQKSLSITDGNATICLHPPENWENPQLRATYFLDYGQNAYIPRQSHTINLSPESFVRDVADARTFLLEYEALAFRAAGLGKHLTPDDLLVFGERGLIENQLRHANEPARHKLLDMVGDLSLMGVDLVGHLIAYRSGHSLNVELARKLADKIFRMEPVQNADMEKETMVPVRRERLVPVTI